MSFMKGRFIEYLSSSNEGLSQGSFKNKKLHKIIYFINMHNDEMNNVLIKTKKQNKKKPFSFPAFTRVCVLWDFLKRGKWLSWIPSKWDFFKGMVTHTSKW